MNKKRAVKKSKQDVVLGSFIKHWRPKDYLNEFYQAPVVVADEIEAIKFQIDVLKKMKKKPVALEFGSGPTAHRLIAAAPYVSEIHVVDYLDVNLKELKRWVDKHEDRHNWEHYVRYILKCEGIQNPSQQQITQREDIARKKITRFSKADAGKKNPLGKKYAGYYSHVYSGFCADSATGDQKTWFKFMRNIASLVSPGGTFFTAALRKSAYYKVGKNFFPSANIDEHDLRRVLELDFLPGSITMEVRDLPELAPEGYEGIVLAYAVKK